MKRYIEDSELIAVLDWAQYNPILEQHLIHIENERGCEYAAGKRRKRKGVKKGVSDLFLPYPQHGYYGLWIEMKGPKNKKGYKCAPVTEDQKKWLELMKRAGYDAVVCYGADAAIQKLTEYIEPTYTVAIFGHGPTGWEWPRL
jgi:hypothetical protein